MTGCGGDAIVPCNAGCQRGKNRCEKCGATGKERWPDGTLHTCSRCGGKLGTHVRPAAGRVCLRRVAGDACSLARAGVRTYRPRSCMLCRAQIRAICQSDPSFKLGAIMIFRSYERPTLEYTPTQAKRLVVAPMVRSMFGCVSGSAIGPPHQLESQSPCPLPAFVAAAAALTFASVNQ